MTHRQIALLALKLLLTVPVALALGYAFLHREQSGMVREVEALGPWGAFLVISVFLALVFAYARDLKTVLALVDPAHRAAAPGRAWLMLVIPYNFIDDFFIVHDVAKSLRAQAAGQPGLARFSSFGSVSGWGWCAAQLLSLAPHAAGAVAGWVALVFWAWHWLFIRRALTALRSIAGQAEASCHPIKVKNHHETPSSCHAPSHPVAEFGDPLHGPR